MTRNDIHCPSKIQPQDYTFVAISTATRSGLGYHGFVLAQQARIRAHMAQTGGAYATHEHGGNCMSCGAHCLYMAVFHHGKSNEYIATGMDCAEKIGIGDPDAFRIFSVAVDAARHHAAGKRKADGVLQLANLSNAWQLYLAVHELPRMLREAGFNETTPLGILADFAEETQTDNALVLRAVAERAGKQLTRQQTVAIDIVSKLIKYGSLSDRQVSYLRHLIDEIEGKPVAKLAPEQGSPAPQPQGPRTYTVTSRRGTRSVTTSLIDPECLQVLASVPNDNFAADLARQGADRGLSPRQWEWAYVIAQEFLTAQETRRTEEAAQLNQAQPVVANEDQMIGILNLFTQAKEHLQYPKIRLACQGRRYRLWVAGERARNPGWVNVDTDGSYNERTRVGQISTDGLFIPGRDANMNEHNGLVDLLRRLAEDPTRVAAEYGRELGECCFCGLGLTDERSTAVGYGETCARQWGRPWGEAGKEEQKARVNRERKCEAVLGVK